MCGQNKIYIASAGANLVFNFTSEESLRTSRPTFREVKSKVKEAQLKEKQEEEREDEETEEAEKINANRYRGRGTNRCHVLRL